MEDKILKQIKINHLQNYEKGFVISQLCVLNNKSFDEINKIVEKLERKGLLNFSQPKENVKPAKAKRQSGQIEGKIMGTRHGYAFLVPSDVTQEDVFISGRNLNGAIHNDIVRCEIIYYKGKKEAKVTKILQRGNTNIVGTIELGKRYAYVTPDDVKFGSDILIPMNRTLGANNKDKVVIVINKYFSGNKSPEGAVTEVLGPADEIETQVLSIIRSYGLYDTFPKKVQEAARNIPTEVDIAYYKNRRNLSDKLIFTIDGADTRDIDDAISLDILKNGNYSLGVHIADVGEYVKLGNVFDQEAFKRGTSVYMPNKVIPMLPKEFSNGICSLNPNVHRLALSVVMEIDKQGRIVNHDIFESIIKSKRQFTYDTVYAILQGDPKAIRENKPFVETLKSMNELAKILLAKLKRDGSMEFNFPEAQFELSGTGEVLNVTARKSDESHELIEAFMIAANQTVSKEFFDKKVPFLYRVHEKPDVTKMENFLRLVKSYGIPVNFSAEGVEPKQLSEVLDKLKDKDFGDGLSRICLRSQKKAKYMPQCLGHFGLALKYYSHFTSPIRRYPDLTIHRIIKDSLHGQLTGQNLSNYKNFVVASGYQSSDREVNADKLERDVDDLYKAVYMSKHIGEVYEGRVSGVTNFGVFVELENTCEGLIKLTDMGQEDYTLDEDNFTLTSATKMFKMGDRVKVEVYTVNVAERAINFILAEN